MAAPLQRISSIVENSEFMSTRSMALGSNDVCTNWVLFSWVMQAEPDRRAVEPSELPVLVHHGAAADDAVGDEPRHQVPSRAVPGQHVHTPTHDV